MEFFQRHVWARAIDLSSLPKRALAYEREMHAAGKAVAVRNVIPVWAKQICDGWGMRGMDGFQRLIDKYETHTTTMGTSEAARRFNELKDKLGEYMARPATFVLDDYDQSDCCKAVEMCLAQLRGSDDPFLEDMPQLIDEWFAE